MHKILLLGSGGREHCLAWKLAQSPKCEKLYIAPGNGGTLQCGENILLDIGDFATIEYFVNKVGIDYIIVGPEAPLVEGIWDHFRHHPVKVLGPSAEAARLEGSKSFANDFMHEFNIPTAGYLTVEKDTLSAGLAFIDAQDSKIVLKADGLAAGKGVLILDDKEEAKKELRLMLEGKFGEASKTVVLEEFLDGIEFSVFVMTDGSHYCILPEAKDYKRIGEGDTGLNTGGMGAVSPVPFADDVLMEKVRTRIIEPTIKGISARGFDYTGFIFLGLICVNNEPYVIEYNVRMGDPETQAVLPRLENDLVSMVEAVFDGTLADVKVKTRNETAASVVLVSGGYPGSYEKGKDIRLPAETGNSLIFHAGTKLLDGVRLITAGGRVLAVTSFGSGPQSAVTNALELVDNISFENMNYRKDIGFDL